MLSVVKNSAPLCLISPFIFVFFFSPSAFADNKKIVRDFYETAFTKHQPVLAMKNYVGSRYIQHNPHVPDGQEPFIAYFTDYYRKNPTASTRIMRVISEGDLVVVHAHSRSSANDPGYAAIDIFRLEEGKIVEHWDVVQKVPTTSANSNTMF